MATASDGVAVKNRHTSPLVLPDGTMLRPGAGCSMDVDIWSEMMANEVVFAWVDAGMLEVNELPVVNTDG